MPPNTPRRIAVLPEALANKIAAGEVIQRPASAVKELLENALDAGASQIIVTVRQGGLTYLQVADNGYGMDEVDAIASFQRHATSKIATYEELEAIRTFGFRGEALASISAVAQVTMLTRRPEDEMATVIHVDGGGMPRLSRDARLPGTTVTVQNLFYNVPARKKFLKSASTEFRHLYDAVHRIALSHHEVGIRFASDGEVVFDLRPGTREARLIDLFGERQVRGLVSVHEETDVAMISGYLGKPSFGQRTRTHQYLFLNGRTIISRTLQHALLTGYEHLLIKGTFPFYVLFLDVDPRRVDVNVHPSKMEVKFEDEQSLHHLVAALVRKALAGTEVVPGLTLRGGGESGFATGLRFTPGQHDAPRRDDQHDLWTGPARPDIDPSTGEIVRGHPDAPRAGPAGIPEGPLLPHEGDRQPAGTGDALIWQLHNKYILSQIRNGLMIVDQHVAHERILYERALERFERGVAPAQQLLFPFTIELSAGDVALVDELLPHLHALGFDIKVFGKRTVMLEGVPADVRPGNEERIVQEMLELYREYSQQSPVQVRDNLAKSFSCRSAIKAGDHLSEEEMRSLIDQLFATKMPYVCPHGRPVVLRIPLDELDRRFGRL